MLFQTGGPELGPGRVTDTGNKRRHAAFKAGGADKETFEEGFAALFHRWNTWFHRWNHVEHRKLHGPLCWVGLTRTRHLELD